MSLNNAPAPEIKHAWVAWGMDGPALVEITQAPIEPGGRPRLWVRDDPNDRWYLVEDEKLFATEAAALASLVQRFTEQAERHEHQAGMYRKQAEEARERAAHWAERLKTLRAGVTA